MTRNIGIVDSLARQVLGLLLLVLPFVSTYSMFAGSTAKVVAVVAGLLLVGTSAVRFCPLYRLVGIKTCQVS